MSNLSEWFPNYKHVVGDFTDPHPTADTLTADLPFVTKELRNGRQYEVPVVVSLEQGVTPDVSGDTFTIRDARNSVMKEAIVDGATLLFNANIPYDAMLRSSNGTGNRKQGNAFKDSFIEKTRQVMEQGEHYIEIANHYGPGSGSTIADDIGVLGAAAGGTGTALNTGVTMPITIATWAPGVWTRLNNALVDLYNSAGNTLIANNVIVSAVDPTYAPAGSPVAPNVSLISNTVGNNTTTVGANTAIASLAGLRIVPAAWATKGCIGLVSQFKNTGTQFNISASAYPNIWKPHQIATTGTLTRLKIQSIGARMFPFMKDKNGVTMYLPAPIFADLAEETETQRQYVDSGEVRKVSPTSIVYRTACGPFECKMDAMMKFGTAIGFGKSAKAVRVGSSPLTFRGKGEEWFFLELPQQAGSQIRAITNFSPFVHEPNKAFIITGLTPNALI